MVEFDVVIIGAGTAGCAVAEIAGKKCSVALIDRKKKPLIGKKVCGDGLSINDYKFLEGIFGSMRSVVERRIKGSIFKFPDGSEISMRGDGCTINRHRMGQLMLRKCLKGDVKLFDDCHVIGVKDKEVIAVWKGSKVSIKGKILVDASGFDSILRKRIKATRRPLLPREFGLAYREIKECPVDHHDSIIIYVDDKRIPNGYGWLFPESGDKINIGLGMEKITGKNPRKAFDSFFNFKGRTLDRGGGQIPLRRVLLNLVDDGFLAVGDAACHTSPINGGGIQTSVEGGKLAAETIVEAIEGGSYKIEDLWNYNVVCQKGMGKKSAFDELAKSIICKLSTEDSCKILSSVSSDGEIKFNKFLPFKILRALITDLKLTKILSKAFMYSMKIRGLYDNYPEDISEFHEWEADNNSLFDEIYRTI